LHGAILGDMSRVEGILHPVRGSVHSAFILARILALLL
jgi:hypothetical protein